MTITNQDKFEEQYQELVNDIENDIIDLIREKLKQSHNDFISCGMKFNYNSNNLDYVINQYVFKNGFNNAIEQVLNEVDKQKEYY